MVLGINWLDVLLGLVLPMLVALVTNNVANAAVKAVVLAVLAAISGIVQALIAVGGDLTVMDWNGAMSAAVTTFLIGVGMHFGLLKPVGLTGKDSVLGRTGANSDR